RAGGHGRKHLRAWRGGVDRALAASGRTLEPPGVRCQSLLSGLGRRREATTTGVDSGRRDRRFEYAVALVALTVLLGVTGSGTAATVAAKGLRHDTLDAYYRSPSGPVPAGTSVTLRLRTAAGGATAVTLRAYVYDA